MTDVEQAFQDGKELASEHFLITGDLDRICICGHKRPDGNRGRINDTVANWKRHILSLPRKPKTRYVVRGLALSEYPWGVRDTIEPAEVGICKFADKHRANEYAAWMNSQDAAQSEVR